MKNLTNIKRRYTAILLAIFIVFSIALSAVPASEIDDKVIFSCMQLLKEEYIEDVSRYKLLKGAAGGMESYLNLKKIDSSQLKNIIDEKRTIEANLRALSDAFHQIATKNSDKLSREEFVYAALDGMAKSIQEDYDDPYTVALEPKEFRMLQESLNSEGFSGVGIYIEINKKNNNALTIVEPIEGSPAHKAGLKPGDIIVRINDVSTRGMSIGNASNRIRGPVKSPVILHIKRKNKTFDVKVVRDFIQTDSVTYKMIDRIGYIKIRAFGETTTSELLEAIEQIEKNKGQGIILDLRNNGGGYIITAVQVSSQFLLPDQVVTSVVNYRKDTKDIQKSFNTKAKKLPLAVLVNEYSASASEITAGCIQENHSGILIGDKTFGKGSVQTFTQLPGGGAFKYTTAHYLTPNGRDINKKGIKPDIKVEMDTSDIGGENDKQLNQAIQYLEKEISKKPATKIN